MKHDYDDEDVENLYKICDNYNAILDTIIKKIQLLEVKVEKLQKKTPKK